MSLRATVLDLVLEETEEPMGARLDLITGDLACPDENGGLTVLAEVLGGVVCAIDLLMATALRVSRSVGGLPCMARHRRFMSSLEVCHAYAGSGFTLCIGHIVQCCRLGCRHVEKRDPQDI